MKKVPIHVTVNEVAHDLFVDPRASLLEVLRNDLHLTSVKKGCEVGECGACSVLINDEVMDSCIYLAIWSSGKEIRTLEGLMDEEGNLSDIQQAFIDEVAVQCGFCTPGFIMAAIPILESDQEYSRDEIRTHLAGNLCRCTGYEKITNAILKTKEKRMKVKNKV